MAVELYHHIEPCLAAPWLFSEEFYYDLANAHYTMVSLDRQIYEGEGDFKEKHKRSLKVLDQGLKEFLSLAEEADSDSFAEKCLREYIDALIDLRKQTADLSK